MACQRALSEIYFASQEAADIDVVSSTRTSEAERDSDGPTLQLLARLVRPARPLDSGIVTRPLEAQLGHLGRISGRVVTKDGTPVMHAEVEAPMLDKRVTTDAAGRFVIPGAPTAGSVSLTVTARNRSMEVKVDAARQADVTIVIAKESAHA